MYNVIVRDSNENIIDKIERIPSIQDLYSVIYDHYHTIDETVSKDIRKSLPREMKVGFINKNGSIGLSAPHAVYVGTPGGLTYTKIIDGINFMMETSKIRKDKLKYAYICLSVIIDGKYVKYYYSVYDDQEYADFLL